MSNSVDAAIYDYFSLLLADEAKEALADPRTELLQAQPVAEALDKAALAQLLAPVAEAHSSVAEIHSSVAEAHSAVIEPQLRTSEADEAALKAVPVKEAQIELVDVRVQARAEDSAKAAAKQTDGQPSASAGLEQSDTNLSPEVQTEPDDGVPSICDTLDDEFQVLFFKVAGLTLAVPLVSLGGIVQMGRVNHIMGRPKWFHGVQAHRDSQLNIVDTCAWVMPEKYDDKLAQSIDYQYIVLLEGSNWGLACESLVNSVKMVKSQVNWRSKAGKRPWLAGMVKQQMCGILNVPALITRLNSGLGSQDPID